jgi:RHS repeat-associated protein
MIAGKHFDPIVGVDIHIIQPPGPVPPVPVPHPFIGFVFDPMDYAPFIGATVEVNGMKRAVAGSQGRCVPPHIPIGGVFVKPPANECEVFMGSLTVAFDGDPATRLGEPVLSCHDVGMPPIPRLKRGGKVKSMVLPTSVLLAVPAGPPVLVGGPPTISLMALGMKLGMAVLGKALAKLRALQKSSKRWAALSRKLRAAANKVLEKIPGGQKLRNAVNKGICSLTGHPVDVATGKVLTDAVDFDLPGPLPLRFERTWYSVSAHDGPLGHGWHHSYDLALSVYPEGVVARLGDGRYAPFDAPQVDRPTRNTREKLTLRLTAEGYVLEDALGLCYVFDPPVTAGQESPLVKVRDANGNTIEFVRHGKQLRAIIDSAGRELLIDSDQAGRIRRISGPDPERPGASIPLVTYAYSAAGDLVESRDPLGARRAYAYQNHLLVRETDPDGTSFAFAYDGEGTDARCVRTWGDGGIYARQLDYDVDGRRTTVTDSLGHRTVYDWNELGLVTRKVDPLGGETLSEWDEDANKLAETNPCGETVLFEYDERGRRTAIVGPLGDRCALTYDEVGNCTAVSDALGNTWRREFDDRRNLLAVTDPLGHRWSYEVNSRGQLVVATDPVGKTVQVEYDPQANVRRIRNRTGGETWLEHDALGRLVRRIDAAGGETRFSWDRASRLERLRDAEGRDWAFRHDASGNLTEAIDPLGRRLRYFYGPRGALTRVEERSGAPTDYRLDTEGRLVGVVDALGREWLLERDAVGNIVGERTCDGRRLRYEYDAAGRLRLAVNAAGQGTAFHRNEGGRVCRRVYHDATEETFTYDLRGLLVEAANTDAAIAWEYDAAGQVVAETVAGQTVRHEYDALGNRVARVSPLGHRLQLAYDAEGRLERLADAAGPLLAIANDPLGRERRRELPGGVVCETQVAATGEILSTHTQRRGRTLLSREYLYDRTGQLAELRDRTFGVLKFRHDLDWQLVATTYPDGSTERYSYDAAGNVPGTPLGAGGASEAACLSQDGAWRLLYDADHNLIEKASAAARYSYQYDAAGRLARVARDGQEVVAFRYDPLGRRVRKVTPKGAVEFLWDGDLPLGERPGGDSSPVEYVFMPRSFEPLAVLGTDGAFLLESDHLGTPRSATDRHGEVVWQALYDAFGAVRKELGKAGRVPFRFPGQSADEETGLHYNRVRYYDPTLHIYTTPDPIGLAGGTRPYNYVPSPVGWIDPYGQQPEVIACGSRSEAMRRAQEHAQVPRASRGGEPIPLGELGEASRGENFREIQKNGGTNLGHRDPVTGAEVFHHPDGHPHQVGPGHPPHHAQPHVHATDKHGVEKIFTYPHPHCK